MLWVDLKKNQHSRVRTTCFANIYTANRWCFQNKRTDEQCNDTFFMPKSRVSRVSHLNYYHCADFGVRVHESRCSVTENDS